MALVVRGTAEAAVATGSEAAVLDRAGAQVTVQHSRVHQHDGHVALGQVCLDVLHTHCAVGQEGGSVSASGPLSPSSKLMPPNLNASPVLWYIRTGLVCPGPELPASGNVLACHCGLPFLHSHLAGLGLCKQLVHPGLLGVKVLPVEGLKRERQAGVVPHTPFR